MYMIFAEEKADVNYDESDGNSDYYSIELYHNIQLKNNNWLEIKNAFSWNKKCENKVRVCMYWKEVKMMKARDTGCIAGVPSASPKNLVTRIR